MNNALTPLTRVVRVAARYVAHCAMSFVVGGSCVAAVLLGGAYLSRGIWLDHALPGTESAMLHHLDPRFRVRVDDLLEELRSDGLHPRIAATFRDSRRQDFVFHAGKLAETYGWAPSTQLAGGRSCHNRRGERPASLAIDIVPGRARTTLAQQATFYRALGRAASARGLAWGGSWSQRNRAWRRFGLGWDPAHVQSARCR